VVVVISVVVALCVVGGLSVVVVSIVEVELGLEVLSLETIEAGEVVSLTVESTAAVSLPS
jgi:hypothetical protein